MTRFTGRPVAPGYTGRATDLIPFTTIVSAAFVRIAADPLATILPSRAAIALAAFFAFFLVAASGAATGLIGRTTMLRPAGRAVLGTTPQARHGQSFRAAHAILAYFPVPGPLRAKAILSDEAAIPFTTRPVLAAAFSIATMFIVRTASRRSARVAAVMTGGAAIVAATDVARVTAEQASTALSVATTVGTANAVRATPADDAT
jgi:hypothetical protein